MPNPAMLTPQKAVNKPLASMTGYARAAGEAEAHAFTIEMKSVNARSLDLRIRLPAGMDRLEPRLRALLGTSLTRGSVTVNLNIQRDASAAELSINQPALDAVVRALNDLSGRVDAQKPSLDGILALKGVLETGEKPLDEAAEVHLSEVLLQAAEQCLADLVTSRQQEGARLATILNGHIDEIERLTALAEAHPSRSREAILQRLTEQVADLGETGANLSEDRLHQEALLLATKADIREELDRLKAHVDAARALLGQGGAVGRKLDFLAQEFNREANTLCSKSNAVDLTAIGLDLKAVIDQLREQIQNLE